MIILLAAASAAVWGSADFCGGKASQRSSPLGVSLWSQVVGLPLLAVLLAVTGAAPTWAALYWGAPAGLAGAAGLVLLYRGLSRGAMAVFAPVTAVTAAIVPLAAGLLLDRRPGPLALLGVGCAVLAIALVSLERRTPDSVVTPAVIGEALAAGAMFGVFFTLLHQAGSDAGLWPLAGARVGSLGLLLVLWLVQRGRRGRPAGGMGGRWAAGAGVLDMGANALYLVAVQSGPLAIVAPIASLYPVSTVLLALAVDRERLRPVRIAGLLFAVAALALVAGG